MGAGSDHSTAPGQVSLSSVSRIFETPAGPVEALVDVNFQLAPGQVQAVTGRSGSGKSTMLGLIAGFDVPTSGNVSLGGTATRSLTESQRSRWRLEHVGYVFQSYRLLPGLTALENVRVPMDLLADRSPGARSERARVLLDDLGVAAEADRFPSQLSGGQQQRVAIARALANEPALLLADEPTGNLDLETATGILDVFARLGASGTTVLMATHEPNISEWVDGIVHLERGRIVARSEGAQA